jgi:hypothetical protein
MKKVLIGLLALGTISSFAATEHCSFEVNTKIKQHQSFIGLVDDSDDYVPSRLQVTTLTLSKEGSRIHFEELKLKSVDNLVTQRRVEKWAHACSEAVYNLNEKAVNAGCDSEVLEKISNIECAY